jgi:hypothetical protein
MQEKPNKGFLLEFPCNPDNHESHHLSLSLAMGARGNCCQHMVRDEAVWNTSGTTTFMA